MKFLTLGTFDLFHYGHYKLINGIQGSVYIGLNTDDFIKKYKGSYPIMNYKERELSIKTSFPNAIIIPNDQKDGTIKKVLDKVKPNVIVIGSDWLQKDYLKQIGLTRKDFEKRQMLLLYVPYTPNISTSMLKKRIAEY